MIVLVVLAYRATTIPTEVSETALQQSSNVYFSNGKSMIGTFSTGTNRQLLTSAQIPPVLKNAVIAAEDRHFYTRRRGLDRPASCAPPTRTSGAAGRCRAVRPSPSSSSGTTTPTSAPSGR